MGDVPWRTIEDRLRAQDPTAMRAVLWAFRRRTDPGLEFATFDVPGWRRRLSARIERAEIDEVLTNLMAEAMSKNEDSVIDAVTPHLRKLADNRDDVDAALDALGKGHLVKGRQGTSPMASSTAAASSADRSSVLSRSTLSSSCLNAMITAVPLLT